MFRFQNDSGYSFTPAGILYVMFFFGATGGMIGVAAQAGRWWAVATSLVFIVMAVLAFIQRAMTGL